MATKEVNTATYPQQDQGAVVRVRLQMAPMAPRVTAEREYNSSSQTVGFHTVAAAVAPENQQALAMVPEGLQATAAKAAAAEELLIAGQVQEALEEETEPTTEQQVLLQQTPVPLLEGATAELAANTQEAAVAPAHLAEVTGATEALEPW